MNNVVILSPKSAVGFLLTLPAPWELSTKPTFKRKRLCQFGGKSYRLMDEMSPKISGGILLIINQMFELHSRANVHPHYHGLHLNMGKLRVLFQ